VNPPLARLYSSLPASRGRQRILLVATTIAAIAIAVYVVQPLTAFDILTRLFARIVWRVDTPQPLVALSFDDGPDPLYTPQVLDILARHRAHATFFLIGERAAANPELVERIESDGHEVGNHYYTRGSTLLHSSSTFSENLARTEGILGLAEKRPKLFRPPGGLVWPSQLTIAQERGYTTVLGSAYPYDPRRAPAAYIRWLVSKNLAPGVIVILHDAGGDRSRTLAALPGILEAGRRKGLRFVTVGELFAATDLGGGRTAP